MDGFRTKILYLTDTENSRIKNIDNQYKAIES
jgi:hypothetical protein